MYSTESRFLKVHHKVNGEVLTQGHLFHYILNREQTKMTRDIMLHRNHFLLILPLLYNFTCFSNQSNSIEGIYDVTVVGYILFANGLGRNPISVLDFFQDSLQLNFKNSRPNEPWTFSLEDVPENVQSLLTKNNQSPSNVAIMYDALAYPKKHYYKQVPESKIKIAYSMLESTKIPDMWTSIINEHFDAVVVPDSYYVDVYKNSGVRKPIFMLPMILYLDKFLSHPIKTKRNSEFVFGVSCSLSKHKNLDMLVDSFAQEYGNVPHVKLKIHTASDKNSKPVIQLKEKLNRMGINNIDVNASKMPLAEYLEFMSSLDCYVLISKGEGFSVTPREALALGIPCILSNNTGHQTLCQTDFVYAVKSDIREKPANDFFECCNFNCRREDVQKGLRDVFENYDHWLAKAHLGREWVKQYHANNLKKRYLNLFKPTHVILGPANKITDEFLMTNDNSLYSKYLALNNLNKDTSK